MFLSLLIRNRVVLPALCLALLDRDGNVIAPPEYSRIQVPFADRYVLYTGWTQTIDGSHVKIPLTEKLKK